MGWDWARSWWYPQTTFDRHYYPPSPYTALDGSHPLWPTATSWWPGWNAQPQHADGPPDPAHWPTPLAPTMFLPWASYDTPSLQNTARLPRPSDFDHGPPPLVDPVSAFASHPTAWPQHPRYAPSWTPMPAHSPFLPMPTTPAASMRELQPLLFTRPPSKQAKQSPRPESWRRDYVPPHAPRLLSRLRRQDKTEANLEHCHLSALLLMPNTKTPIMCADLRSDDPLDPLSFELLTIGDRPFNPTDLSQLATSSPVHRLRFYHDRLPWHIDVCASQPNGVLVGDVLRQIHENLHQQIEQEDFYNKELNAVEREEITEAYRTRCVDRLGAIHQGVRRVDYLGEDVILCGFVEGRNGMWLMKTSRVDQFS